MNKNQKLVQQEFLNNEEKIIKRLEQVYHKSLTDITDKVAELDSSITMLQQAYGDIDADGIGDLAALALGKKANKLTSEQAKATLKSMLQSKIYQKQYQQALQKQIDGVLDKMLTMQYTEVSAYLQQCYEDGFIGTMFDLQGQGIPLCYPLDQEAMVRAVQLDSKISEGLYKKMGVDVKMLKGRITANVSRGISSGMTYAQVAQQIDGSMNIGFNKAIRIARTEGHRIQVQSGMDACYKAKDMGADVVKQWDSSLDKKTRASHRKVDGEIRELDEPFSNGLMFPGDPDGGAGEVVNCRCALLQRARWALDDDELEVLKERAKYYGLDKTANFEDFKDKYLNAAQQTKPKKEYLTEKKLQKLLSDGDVELKDLKKQFGDATYDLYDWDEFVKNFNTDYSKVAYDATEEAMLKAIGDKIEDLTAKMDDWQMKLDKKILAKETKILKKVQMELQDQIDAFPIDTYSGIWKDDVTVKDWIDKKDAVNAKLAYFKQKLSYATDADDIKKWNDLIDLTNDFNTKGAEYSALVNKLNKAELDLKKLKNGVIKTSGDAFTQDRKDAAYWFTSNNGSVKGADGVLRDTCGEVWKKASKIEKDSIYEYTSSYHKFNEPLRGIEYGTNKFLGVGNVDLNMIGTNYGGYKVGQVKQQIDAMTSIIEKSSYDFDIWVQRGCRLSGMDKFLNVDMSDFSLPEADLAAKLIGTEPIEYAFLSTGVAKGKGLNTSGGIVFNIFAPKGTKMMYAEPFSAFGRGQGRGWDGIQAQSIFGGEAEMILQRETKFRITKVTKSGGTIYIDMDVIGQGEF